MLPLKWVRRRHRMRSIPNEHEKTSESRPIKRKCASVIKVIKLSSAILVPLMIGAFTVISTIQESQRVQQQRDADIIKLERQIKLQQEVDTLRTKNQQEHDDNNAREIRIQNVYDAYMKEISSIALKENKNLTVLELLFMRAKTAVTLEQIDARRKGYLVKFLYDSQLLYWNMSGMRYIDLTDTDLSNIKLGADEQFARRVNLRAIRLTRVQLRNSSFENVNLNQANFQYSSFNHSRFLFVSIAGADFRETVMENAQFLVTYLTDTSFKTSNLKSSFWFSESISKIPFIALIDYSDCDLSDATFRKIGFKTSVNFNQANLERVTFSDVKFSSGMRLQNLNMKMVNFSAVEMNHGEFIRCHMFGAIFDRSHMQTVLFDDVDLQQSQFNDVNGLGNLKFNKVNLIGSNLNTTSNRVTSITDSLLPDGTFKTTYDKFGVNLINNGDAEQGPCPKSNQSLSSTVFQTSLWQGNAAQMRYNPDDWKTNMSSYMTDWQSCFFGGHRNVSSQSKSNENIIRQEFNLTRLSLLINARQLKFHASAYLGGFRKETGSTKMKVTFQNTQNLTMLASTSSVTNIHRQNETAMLFWSENGTVPVNTTVVKVELIFELHKSSNAMRFGMADNVKFVIQPK